MINIENMNMSASDEKPITDEDILEKIKELRYRVANEQCNRENTLHLVDDVSRNEYYIIFRVVTDKSKPRKGEVRVEIGHTTNGKELKLSKGTLIEKYSDRVVVEMVRNFMKFVDFFFENAPDRKKQRPAYDAYLTEMKKNTILDKSGSIPALVCQNFETNVESRPHVELPQIDEMANLNPVRTFYGAFLSLVDLYHPAVIIMHLLKESVEDFPYYVTDHLSFDDKYEKFIHDVRRDEMTIRDLFEKGITPAHVCEILLDALKENYDEAKNIPDCFSIASDNVFSFVKDFCEKVCKSKEKPIDVPYQVEVFISTCEELGFSSAKSVHALLRACYDSVDNMMNFFNGTFKWSDTMVDDPEHFLGFLNGDYGMEMNEMVLLGDLYNALTARYPIKLLNKVATEMQCNYMGDSLIGDGTPQSKNFTQFLILLVNKLQFEEQAEEVNDEEPIQPVDTECFAVGVKGVSLEQFKKWLKYHPGASFELL